ncbi:MAG: ribosomal protein S18-alanine N-acetyltransferase [Syntrophaceae bacterium]
MDALIRPASRKDLPAIMEIEKQSFISPWDSLAMFLALDDPQGRGTVAWAGKTLVGYCFAHAMHDMLHILNLAVRPACRRQGVARQLLNDLIAFGEESGRLFAFLEVRSSNGEARALYADMGFRHVCTWRKYYQDTHEDAEIMLKGLTCRI